jgi:hypothetical protein
MNARIQKLGRVAQQGGRVGAKGVIGLQRARAALAVAQAALAAEKLNLSKASQLRAAFEASKHMPRSAAVQRIGRAAAALEGALSSSRIGSNLIQLGRLASSKTFGRCLIIVAAASAGAESYLDSTAQTTDGKVFNATLGAAGGALTMAIPQVALADWALPDGYKLSEVYHGTAGAVTAIREFVTPRPPGDPFEHDTKPMDDFHRKAMQGHYGKVFQFADSVGEHLADNVTEWWMDKGLKGGLSDLVESVHWWQSLVVHEE